jgi:hypothetical protein
MRKLVGFEVLTVAVMKNTTFWNIIPCSPLKDFNRLHGNISQKAVLFMRKLILQICGNCLHITYRTVPIQHSPVSKCHKANP